MNRRRFLKLIGCAVAAHALKLPAIDEPLPVDFKMFRYIPTAAPGFMGLHPFMVYDLLNDPETEQIDMSLIYADSAHS